MKHTYFRIKLQKMVINKSTVKQAFDSLSNAVLHEAHFLCSLSLLKVSYKGLLSGIKCYLTWELFFLSSLWFYPVQLLVCVIIEVSKMACILFGLVWSWF